MIPIVRPLMDEREANAASRVIMSGWITQGPEVAAFEAEFAAAVGAAHACAVSNCTTALHLALLALGIGAGDEVITVSHSYIATANSIAYCGATPVFIDIDPATYNLDPSKIAAAITPCTKAILCVHQIGMPCDLAAILAVSNAHGLPVIEDAACAIGSEVKFGDTWERIGAPRGAVACFSFHPRKVLSTGDGGMLTTRDPNLDQKFRLLRHHGMVVNDRDRHSSATVVFESHSIIGYNYRLTDIQAAIGREQLKRLPEIIEARRCIAQKYVDRLSDIPGLTFQTEPAWAKSNWQSFAVRLPAQCEQRAVMQAMLDQGIATRRGIMCAHREDPYLNSEKPGSLVESEHAQDACIILPLYPQMTDDEHDEVCDQLRAAVTR